LNEDGRGSNFEEALFRHILEYVSESNIDNVDEAKEHILNWKSKLSLFKHSNVYEVSFEARFSKVLGFLEEFYNIKKDVFEFNIKLKNYVPIADDVNLIDRFQIICDIDKWKKIIKKLEN